MFKISFDQTITDIKLVIKNVLEFLGISHLINIKAIDDALAEFSYDRYLESLKTTEHRLYELNLVRAKRGISGVWIEGLTPAHKLLFKKVAGDFLIELGYERNFNW